MNCEKINLYSKIQECLKKEGIIIKETFQNSLKPPGEQFEIFIYKSNQQKEDKREIKTLAEIIAPQFSDDEDFAKCVRMTKCYGLYQLAQKYKGLKRHFLFSDTYLTNHIRDILSWKEARKFLEKLGIIDKPMLLKRKTIFRKVFRPKYQHSTSSLEFEKVKLIDRAHFCKNNSLYPLFHKVSKGILNLIKLGLLTYIAIATLVIFSRNNIPLPPGFDLKDMSANQIFSLFVTLFFYIEIPLIIFWRLLSRNFDGKWIK